MYLTCYLLIHRKDMKPKYHVFLKGTNHDHCYRQFVKIAGESLASENPNDYIIADVLLEFEFWLDITSEKHKILESEGDELAQFIFDHCVVLDVPTS